MARSLRYWSAESRAGKFTTSAGAGATYSTTGAGATQVTAGAGSTCSLTGVGAARATTGEVVTYAITGTGAAQVTAGDEVTCFNHSSRRRIGTGRRGRRTLDRPPPSGDGKSGRHTLAFNNPLHNLRNGYIDGLLHEAPGIALLRDDDLQDSGRSAPQCVVVECAPPSESRRQRDGSCWCEGCLMVRSDHGPQAEVAQGVGPGPLVEL